MLTTTTTPTHLHRRRTKCFHETFFSLKKMSLQSVWTVFFRRLPRIDDETSATRKYKNKTRSVGREFFGFFCCRRTNSFVEFDGRGNTISVENTNSRLKMFFANLNFVPWSCFYAKIFRTDFCTTSILYILSKVYFFLFTTNGE